MLIVDDDPNLRKLIRATVEDEDHVVLEAADGVEALNLARKHLPDLMLLDIAMPRMDGVKVCKEIKADPATRNITVVMLTAKGQERDRQAAQEAGAEAYFTKPFSPLALLNFIAEHLPRSQP
uniref:Response regulator n=1 Tax=Thermorudis sp. TaxID=1969470 RepID=A0A7C2W5T2_9BACT